MPEDNEDNVDPKFHNQLQVFKFFREKLKTQESFSKKQLEDQTNWKGRTFGTYWSKQFEPFTIPAGKGLFRVSEAFRPYTNWKAFRHHVTQVRRFSDYTRTSYEHVLSYEFFMPLTNEAHLKTALDALFYKDTIRGRLKSLDPAQLQAHFPRESGETEDDYLNRACRRVSEYFVGYSISHVSGRLLAETISTMAEAAEIQAHGGRYLIDETTAAARFIFPCETTEQAQEIEWFFKVLFIESILQVVNAEDEIWMLESGLRNRLHIWHVQSK